MKKILYTMAILLLATVASNAQYTQAVVIKNAEMAPAMKMYRAGNETYQFNSRETILSQNHSTPSLTTQMMFLDGQETDLKCNFSTRIHPYPANNQLPDTARYLVSREDPSKSRNLGDILIPQVVGDGTKDGIAFIQNGFAQFVMPLKAIYPQLTDGEFTIDTIFFHIYPLSKSPVSKDFLFTIQNVDLPKLGTDSFRGAQMSYNDIWDNLDDALTISATDINSRLDGTSIKTTILDLTQPNLSEAIQKMRKHKTDEPYLFMLTKDDMNEIKDTLIIIGAWEWTLKSKAEVYANCLAASINHYPSTNKDTISTTTGIYWNYKDNLSSLQIPYPALYNSADSLGRIFLRQNLTFGILGRYTGMVNTTVKEIESGSNSFELSQNYPNPVVNSTNIKFSTKEYSRVILNLYNSVGQLVHMMVDRDYAPGAYEVNFDASNLPAGTYYYTMTIGSFSKTLPMTIAR